MTDAIEQLHKLWEDAAMTALDNSRRASGTAQQKNTAEKGGEVKQSQRLGGYYPDIKVSTKDISIFGIKDINDLKEVKYRVYNYLLGKYVSNDKISKPIKNIDTGMDIYIYKGGIDETFGNTNAYKNLYTKNKKVKLATMTSLAKLIKYGEVRSPEASNLHNPKSKNTYAYLTAPIVVDGITYTVNMDIKKTQMGNRFYVHTIKIAGDSPKSDNSQTKYSNHLHNEVDQILPRTNSASGIEKSTSNDSISKSAQKVNNNVKKSDQDVAYGDSNNKITANMTDSQRAKILKNKSINNVAIVKDISADILEKTTDISSWEDINNLFGSKKSTLIQKLASEFGAFKGYLNADINISFEFSKNNFRESYHKQKVNYEQFAKMFSVFDSVVENAIGMEVHNRNTEGYKTDITLNNVYVLMSAFEDGDYIVPVKLEIKEFKDKQNALYVAISLQGIKKAEVSKQGNTENGVTQNSRSAIISIADLFTKINPKDVDFLKYIPNELLTDKQIAAKTKGNRR